MHSLADQNEPNDFLAGVSSFDLTLREVVRDVQSLCTCGTLPRPHNPRNPTMRVRISNTCNADHSGEHWFTLVYTVEQCCPKCRSADVDVDDVAGLCNECGEYWSLE